MASLSPLIKGVKEIDDEDQFLSCEPEYEEGTALDRAREEVEILTQEIEQLKIEQAKLAHDDVSKSLHEQLDALDAELQQLDDLNKLKNFLTVIESIKTETVAIDHLLSLKTGSKSKHESDLRLVQATSHFESIKDTCDTLIKTSPHDNILRVYVEKVLVHYQETLQKLIEPKFEEVLKLLHWPISNTDAHPSHVSNSSSSFDQFFLALLKLDIRPLFEEPIMDEEVIRVSLPIEIMMKSLKKKFFYFFMKKPSKTNQIEKPEWYLTQVLNWIKENQNFLTCNVDPLLKMQNQKWPSAKLQFISGLLALIELKLKSDLQDLIDDDKNFSHTFDEVYSFFKELNSQILDGNSLYIRNYCKIFNLFSKDPFFVKLVSLERKKASQHVDMILESPTAWNVIETGLEDIHVTMMARNNVLAGRQGQSYHEYDEDEDEVKVPEAGDNFVVLIMSIMERSEFISDLRHRRSFIDLIHEVCDDFRLRLSQLTRSPKVIDSPDPGDNCSKWPFCNKYFGILNTLYYLTEILDEWRDLPFFCDLDSCHDKFSQLTSTLKHMIREMQTRIVESLMMQFKSKFYKYAALKWYSMSDGDEEYHVTGSQVFHFLSISLQKLKSSVSSAIFQPMARNVCSETCSMFFNELILKNSFNSDGAAKIQLHVKQHLLSLFKHFVNNPQPLMRDLLGAVTLLSLSRGASILLRDAMNSGDGDAALKDIGVHGLSDDIVKAILKRRLYS